ncbi:MAG: CoA-disulfide reductase [Clostridia bacterium]|nr:CoA-disulfide reductase [Clostridia bacterium]
MKVVIIGGVAGGATAAARIRRLDENAEIIIFERSGYISYANCGLPYYIGGVIEDKDNLTLQTPEGFYRRFRIKAHIEHEVTNIDTINKTVSVTNIKTETSFIESYDKLILSPGAKPILPDFYTENERTFTLRTVEDTLKIRGFIEQNQPKTAVVIGGGFIGIEMAENLSELGVQTTIIQRSNHLLPTIDCDMASFIHASFRSRGVQLLLNNITEKMSMIDNKILLELSNGKQIFTDMVVIAIGVSPENTLAKKAGLELGLKGAIKVNSKMETSVPDIYAVGDAVQVKHYITMQDVVIPLAGPANKQGRIAADNICGLNSEYKGSQGSSVIKLFDMTVATTGINEQQAKSIGYNYEKVILTQNSHAGYYPNATAMTIKLIFEKESFKILGAQIVGYDGVDKRIDVIATAIRTGLRADELKDLDMAYAPPYSSAKDPVNMAGFVAENIKNGIVKQFYYEDIPSLSEKEDVILLDTRTPLEYMRGRAEGFINIPLDDLRERLGELDKTKKIYVMCQSGLRSYLATRILMQNGFDAYNFVGGFRLYSSIKYEELLSDRCYSCGMEKWIDN